MQTTNAIHKTTLAFFAAGATLFGATVVRADTLTFTSTSASNAVAQLSRRYGVSIVFRSAVNSSTPVTFSVDNPDTPDGRVQAMNDLGNALNMDFQKVFVVSKIDPGTTVPDVKIDADGPVVFPDTKVSAREAIQTIAGVDGALTQISSSITGNVVFPSRRMTAATAAAAVAKQTQTVWRAYYGFFTRGQEPARLKGDVVDRDINGQPVTALPLVTFRTPVSKPAPTNGVLADGTGPLTTGPDVSTVPNTTAGAYPGGFPYGYSGFNPYGYANPYGYGGFGYTAPDGGFAYPGVDFTPGVGAEPVMPGMNAPGFLPPGATVSTVPNTNTTILPDYPFSGSFGNTIIAGG